ncbi:MAG TPA: hypothetical protein VJ455_04360 [Ignavibacteria bacterium]|nr:hypothetical protein [Ignavibacteria bacterium]
MANAKYNLTFSDQLDYVYLIEIWSKAVNNNPTIAIKGSGKPITITYRSSSDLFEPVIVSEAALEIISESDLFFKTFFTAKQGDWTLKLYENGVLHWVGQNMTETYNEPYTLFPYKSTIMFSDLGDLEFINYKDGAGFYSGHKTLAQIFFDCTNKLENDLDLTELVNVVTTQAFNDAVIPANKKSFLNTTLINVAAFRDYKNNEELPFTCMEVLKRIMRASGCRLFQDNAKYYVLRIEETLSASGDITAAYNFSSSTKTISATKYTLNILKIIDNLPSGIIPESQNQSLVMSERYNKLIHKYITQETVRKKSEFVFNSEFQKGVKTYNNSNFFPKFFTVSNNILNTKVAEVGVLSSNTIIHPVLEETDKEALLFDILFHPAYVDAQDEVITLTSNISKWYLSVEGGEPGDADTISADALNNVVCATADNLKIQIKGEIHKLIDYAAIPAGVPANAAGALFLFAVMVKVTFSGSGRVYYLFRPPNGTKFLWQKDFEGLFFDKITTPSYNKEGTSYEVHTDDFNIEYDTPVFPENGLANFTIRLYVPRTSILNANTHWYRLRRCIIEKFSVKYVTDEDFSDELVTTITAFTITQAKENIYELITYLGDGPADYVLNSFRIHTAAIGFSNKVTSTWRKLDDASILAAKNIFHINPINKLLTEYQQKITGNYLGNFGFLNMLQITQGASTLRYIQMGLKWDVKAAIRNVDIQEIREDAKVTLVVTTGGPVKREVKAGLPSRALPLQPVFSQNRIALKNPVNLVSSTNCRSQNENESYPG